MKVGGNVTGPQNHLSLYARFVLRKGWHKMSATNMTEDELFNHL